MTLELLKEEGLKLDVSQRTELVHFLIDTLSFGSSATDDDFELTESQKDMLDSRMNDILTGKVNTITAEKSDARIKEKYGF
jgi:putative addiction module component (TIGR02574 family)